MKKVTGLVVLASLGILAQPAIVGAEEAKSNAEVGISEAPMTGSVIFADKEKLNMYFEDTEIGEDTPKKLDIAEKTGTKSALVLRDERKDVVPGTGAYKVMTSMDQGAYGEFYFGTLGMGQSQIVANKENGLDRASILPNDPANPGFTTASMYDGDYDPSNRNITLNINPSLIINDSKLLKSGTYGGEITWTIVPKV